MSETTRIESMAAKPAQLPVALCESCWLDDHARWEPESVNEQGNILMKLTGVDSPEIFKPGSVEVCCMCGTITIAGIYEMRDPLTVYFTSDGVIKDFEFNIYDAKDEQE
jgi:hypothetical protein